MNCIIHNDTPAVGSCGKCGCGICSACVQNSIKADGIDKPVCVNCAVEGISIYIENAKAVLSKINVKKTIWTAILLVGALCIIGGFVNMGKNADDTAAVFTIIFGVFVWASGGFTERFTEKSVEQQIADGMMTRDALRGDNYVWFVYLGKFITWFIKNMFRGLIFPIIYAHFMIWGTKELKAQIAEQQAILDGLIAQKK